MVSSKETIVVAYRGSLVDDGTMDVQDLGAALVAFGDLFRACNETLNGDNSTVSVQVKADFRAGSFEVFMEIVRTFMDHVQSLFNENSFSAAEIAGHLGFIATVSGVNLLEFIKWTKGEKIDKTEYVKNDNMSVNIGSRNIIVHKNIINLFQSIPVRESLEKIIEPVEREGIDAFETRDAEHPENVITSVDKAEQPYFKVNGETVTNVATQNVLVQLLSVSFEALKWRLMLGDTKIYAEIKDAEFVAKVRAGNVSFTNGDVLDVLLEISQEATNGNLKSSYAVLRVNKIIPRMKETELLLNE